MLPAYFALSLGVLEEGKLFISCFSACQEPDQLNYRSWAEAGKLARSFYAYSPSLSSLTPALS